MIEVVQGINYYLHIKDSQVVKVSLPEGVVFENNTLTFNHQEPITFELIVEVEHEDFQLNYVFEKGTKTELIESRYINGQYKRHLIAKEDSKIAMFVLNESSSHSLIEESADVFKDANVEVAYAELSLSNVDGAYRYDLKGDNANVQLRIAALSSYEYTKKYEVSLLHLNPYTYGKMSNYGVVKDHAKLCFDGIGKIEKGNYQSETHQTSKIMVFDKGCVAKANPFLYIDEYDVKASHAAGVGRMDEEHLFYLQSRGLTKNKAMQLITYGYLVPVVDVIENETIKQAFIHTLERRMGD